MEAHSSKPELLFELVKYFLRKFGNSNKHQQIIREQIAAKLNRGPLSATNLNEIEETIKAKLYSNSTNNSVFLPELDHISSRGNCFTRLNLTKKKRSISVVSKKNQVKISPDKCKKVLEQFHRFYNPRFHSMENNIKSPLTQCRHFDKNIFNQWGMISLAQDLKNKKEEKEHLLSLSEQKKEYREIIKQQIQERIEREQCERHRQIVEEEGWIEEDKNFVIKLKRAQGNKRLQRIDQERRDQQATDHSREKAHLRRFEKEIEQKEIAQFIETAKIEDQKQRLRRFQANRHVQQHNLIKMLMKRSRRDVDGQTVNSAEDISVALAVEGERRKIEFTRKMELMEKKTKTVMEKSKSKSFMELQQESAQRAERERIKLNNSFQQEISYQLQRQKEKRKNYLEGLKKIAQEQQAIKKEIQNKYATHCQEVREQAESYNREIDLQKKKKMNEIHKYSAYLRDQIKERLVREEKSTNELSQIEMNINKPFLEQLGLTE